jgi:hypothetical protein
MNEYKCICGQCWPCVYRLLKNVDNNINQIGDNATKTAQMLSNNVNAPPLLVLRCVVLVLVFINQ